MVCTLLKYLYGWKQAPHQYLTNVLVFENIQSDPSQYVKRYASNIINIALYVDDLLMLGNIAAEISGIRKTLWDERLRSG